MKKTSKTKPTLIKTCKFIELTDLCTLLFGGDKDMERAFCECIDNGTVTFGDSNRCLVRMDYMVDMLYIMEENPCDYAKLYLAAPYIKKLEEIIDEDVFIDLEN